jgi:hypothetical protein
MQAKQKLLLLKQAILKKNSRRWILWYIHPADRREEIRGLIPLVLKRKRDTVAIPILKKRRIIDPC